MIQNLKNYKNLWKPFTHIIKERKQKISIRFKLDRNKRRKKKYSQIKSFFLLLCP
jgi:F0F1-type ATP synthase membrane subunit b/b'